MKDIEEIKAELKSLIQKRKTTDESTSEANIEATLVSQLFSLLGWDFLDPTVYDRNSYVRGAGYADIALKIDNEPVIFVEVKKIGKIPTNRIDPQAQMTLPLKELADLIDRTPEEKQAFKYARSKEIPWAILTNFDCLYVFNADQERTILSFRKPEEYLEKFNDLLLLSREKVKGKSLQWQQEQIEKEEIDKNFLEKLKNWRVSLAQNIFNENGDNHILKNEKGDFDFDQLMHIVQRILSRLLIIQIADDREVLRTHNILEISLRSYEDKGDYTKKDYLLREFIDLSHMMDERHNTTIFAPGHPCEKVFISNATFARIIRELCHTSFRKMTADILGATYESYLGYRFSLKNGRIEAEVDQRVRKQAGIYYTPSYIVHYIVDNTLGVKLKDLEDQYGLEAGEKAKDLKIIDPACGSGSFLIYAFDVLAGFYERLNSRITDKQVELSKINSNSDMFERQEQFKHLPPRVSNYPKRILEDHLYGVDLDPAACEIATINLVIKAFEKMRDKKLPLILNQNVKVGNSLISGIEKKEDLKKFIDEITEHIELRRRLKEAEDDGEKRDLMKQIDQLRKKVNFQLNESLKKQFDQPEEKRPFNWEFEFPEVFNSEKSKEQKGFDVIVGNPPYGDILSEDEKEYLVNFGYCSGGGGNNDVFRFFTERGRFVLRNKGDLSFILPNTYFVGSKYRNFRYCMTSYFEIVEVINFGINKVFVVDVYSSIFKIRRNDNSEERNQSFMKVASEAVPSDLEMRKLHFVTIPQSEWIQKDWIAGDTICKNILDSKITFELQDICITKDAGINYQRVGVGWQSRTKSKLQQRILYQGNRQHKRDIPYIKGEDFNRYIFNDEFLYKRWLRHNYKDLIENNEVVAFGAEILNAKEKIVTRQTSDVIIGTIDNAKLYTGRSVHSTVLEKGTKYSLKYVLSLLNSKLISFVYQELAKERGRAQAQVKLNKLKVLPIRRIDFSNPSEKTKHDQLVKYADLMLERNKQKNELLKIFEQVLKNHTHDPQPFGKAYYEKPEYVEKIDKKAESIAGSRDEVSKIFIEEHGKTLMFSTLLNGEKKDVLRLKVDNENFRLFLFYAVRKYLEENRRRKKWTTKSLPTVLDVFLGRLEVPVFKTKTKVYDPDHNLKMIDLVMKEFKAKFFKEFPKGNLHLSQIEEEIQDTDNSIDALVFKLYDLNKDEVTTVLDSMETPEITKKDILRKFEAMK
ncbi:MAG: TaqI-like C-terminal specificity domain-containing protein [Candidatus Zixiibacteriota bacterium]